MALKAPEETRQKILDSAFAEFYQHGFQGGSINRIVETTSTTKGALFHHFNGKAELGYSVVDEVIRPLLVERWLFRLHGAEDPVEEIKRSFLELVDTDIGSGHFKLGCPLNNLAQEMSPLDDGFRQRTEGIYIYWREQLADALQRGIDSGKVCKDIDPHSVAIFIVASQTGIWGQGKSSQSAEVMRSAAIAFCNYLDSLKT